MDEGIFTYPTTEIAHQAFWPDFLTGRDYLAALGDPWVGKSQKYRGLSLNQKTITHPQASLGRVTFFRLAAFGCSVFMRLPHPGITERSEVIPPR